LGPTVGGETVLVKAIPDKLVNKIRESCCIEVRAVLCIVLGEEDEASPEGSEDMFVVDIATSNAVEGGGIPA
jgi:hypothetical protein